MDPKAGPAVYLKQDEGMTSSQHLEVFPEKNMFTGLGRGLFLPPQWHQIEFIFTFFSYHTLILSQTFLAEV